MYVCLLLNSYKEICNSWCPVVKHVYRACSVRSFHSVRFLSTLVIKVYNVLSCIYNNNDYFRERSSDGGECPPQFTMRLRDRRVQATYPVRLTCQVIGRPPPLLTWYKNGEEIVDDSTLYISYPISILQILRQALYSPSTTFLLCVSLHSLHCLLLGKRSLIMV